MASADPQPGGTEDSASWPRTLGAGAPGPVGSWESELSSVQHSLKFVLKLREEFVCPVCGGVVLNPQQNSCGHIYCFHCLQRLLETSAPSSPVCPVDGEIITPAEVFQDNCCRREISSLEVFCTNSPACTCVVTLHHLQEHLRACAFEQLPCTDPDCEEMLPRRSLQEHLSDNCPHRREACPRCRREQPMGVIQLTGHSQSCPEVHVQCSSRSFGCSVQDRRPMVEVHEDAAVDQHMLLVLRSTVDLEQLAGLFQEKVQQTQQDVQTTASQMDGLQRATGLQELHASTVQSTLSGRKDVLSTLQREVQRLSLELPGADELDQLRLSLGAVTEDVSEAEALRGHMGTLEENLRRHSGLLDLHVAQLSLNKRRLQELEAASYDGKLIWNIQDFKRRRDAEVKGQPPCLSSVPFHTGSCGYKMAVRAYLNGDGEGRGTHLSLYAVLMPGDFDALLPWPFGQTVTLSVLDQSGAGNHRSLSFRPDPVSKSFRQPDDETASNVAVGFSRFIALKELECGPRTAYVREDTLFVKVKVDMSGLRDL